MKPNNNRNRYPRYNNNNRNRNTNTSTQNLTRHTALESTGPLGKVHGTALQLSEKYGQAAKDALIQNDRILAETFLQFSDHYARLQNIAIANEQASRPQYQARPALVEQASVSTTAPTNADVLPDFDLPPEKNADDELSEEDKTVQSMDLSIPIQTINQNHTKRRFPIRRGGARPEQKTESKTESKTEPAEPKSEPVV